MDGILRGRATAVFACARLATARFALSLMALTTVSATNATPADAAAPNTVCARNPGASPSLTRLRTAMEHGRFVAYEPTSLQVIYGRPTHADPDSIRADLKVLRPRFDSLITYGSVNGAEAIPAIAASLGFRAVIIGIWDPFNPTELTAALNAAKSNPKVVVGISLGNEMLVFHRHSAAELTKLLDTVHTQAPQLPLTTTEPFHIFYEPAATPLLERMDFLLANVHPIFQPWFHTASAGDTAQFVVNVVSQLTTNFCGPILVKETGIPTAPQEKGYTDARQTAFYVELQHRFPESPNRAFAYFSAFDAPWRLKDVGPPPSSPPQPEEAHFGLYTEKRQPKAVVAQISLLTN